MKPLFLLLALGFAGCDSPDPREPRILEEALSRAVDLKGLRPVRLDGLLKLCTPESETPYEGWAKSLHPNGTLKRLGFLKAGQKDGFWISWHDNGQRQEQVQFKADIMDGPFRAWHPNGTLAAQGNINDNEMTGHWMEWYATGVKRKAQHCRDGIFISAVVWTPDGALCPETNATGGNGVVVEYEENGSVEKRRVYLNGVSPSK